MTGQFLATTIKNAVDTLEDASKKIAITIDDAIHADQNMRIMQYQEIILRQHNAIIQMEETFSQLFDAYNIPKSQNEQLTKQIASYRATMQILICGSEFLK